MRSGLTIFAALALALAACGDAPSTPSNEPVGVWSTSKPNPIVGRLRAAVLERLAPNMARIGVEWRALPGVTNCALEIVLPDGVELLDGERTVALPQDTFDGEAEWIVSFPMDRTLDATLRLCADTDGGMRACEAAVRLVTAGR